MNVDILFIGAHIGNTKTDPIYKTNLEKKTVILIEPVPYLYEILMHNYSIKKGNFIFKNIAISDKNGECELYVPSTKNNFEELPEYTSQLASQNPNHIEHHNFNGKKVLVEKIVVPCYKLETFIDIMNIKSIDELHTDTEGHDFDILMNYNFKVKPNIINFENAHTDGPFNRSNKYKILVDFLRTKNYKIIEENNENTIMKLNITY